MESLDNSSVVERVIGKFDAACFDPPEGEWQGQGSAKCNVRRASVDAQDADSFVDREGRYIICEEHHADNFGGENDTPLILTKTQQTDSEVVRRDLLPVGARVDIDFIAIVDAGNTVRGKVRSPMGWITLCAKDSKKRYAKPVDELVDMQPPTDSSGIYYPHYIPFSKEKSDLYRKRGFHLYEEFDDLSLIRLVNHVIYQRVNLSKCKQFNLINDFFPIHDYDDMVHVENTLPTLIPQWLGGSGFKPIPLHGYQDENLEAIKNYLGEEVGFEFNFITSYTQHLVRPLIYNAIYFMMISERFGFIDPDDTFTVAATRIGMALIMSIWASLVCDFVGARETELSIRWGVDQAGLVQQSTDEYDREIDKVYWNFRLFHKWRMVFFWRVLGWLMTAGVIILIVSMTGAINYVRAAIQTDPTHWEGTAKFFTLGFSPSCEGADCVNVAKWGNSVGAILITIQNRIIGMSWDKFSRFLVTKENHHTIEAKHESLTVKIFVIYLFNWTYPSFYQAFIKKHVEGCGLENVPGKGDCMPEVQQGLLMFFVIGVLVDSLILVFSYWLMPFLAIRSEIKKAEADRVQDAKVRGMNLEDCDEVQYTYIEAQAKLPEPLLCLDDINVFMVNFAFIVAFTYAEPLVCVACFIYQCVIVRFYMWQRLRFYKRSVPVQCNGLKTRNTLMRFSVYLSCMVNAGMAVVAKPIGTLTQEKALTIFRGLANYTGGHAFLYNVTAGQEEEPAYLSKALIFVVVEHLLFFAVTASMIVAPDVPIQASRAKERNESMAEVLSNPTASRQQLKEAPSNVLVPRDISVAIFGNQGKFEHAGRASSNAVVIVSEEQHE